MKGPPIWAVILSFEVDHAALERGNVKVLGRRQILEAHSPVT